MTGEPVMVREGIMMFKGNPMISGNLLLEPIVSNAYLLESENEIALFDPSCGKDIGTRIENYVKDRINTKKRVKTVSVIAGHSHFDHSGNLYLGDIFKADDVNIYVHESGFKNGQIFNDPARFSGKKIEECNKYYNFYLSFFFPYTLLTYPFAALAALSPGLAERLFSAICTLAFPRPKNGSIKPKQLREKDKQVIDLGGIKVHGWKVGDKIIISTPGHSPCSVSLFWPEKRALFISDAAWPGNPVFMDASVKECISSLSAIKKLIEAGLVEYFLSAHEHVKAQKGSILPLLEHRIQLLESLREEVLSAHRSSGGEKNVRKLTAILIERSPVFRMFRKNSYPRNVAFPHSIVAICLREAGILP